MNKKDILLIILKTETDKKGQKGKKSSNERRKNLRVPIPGVEPGPPG